MTAQTKSKSPHVKSALLARGYRSLRLESLEDRVLLSLTWCGNGANNKWSTAANWVGAVAPKAGDTLVFPAGAKQLENVNDYSASTRFGSITASGTGYILHSSISAASSVQVPYGTLTADSLAADVLVIGTSVSAGANLVATEGTPVAFQGAATGLAPLSYSWQFGDGGSAAGTLAPQHTYLDNGSYTAVLSVTDASGATSLSSTQVTVTNVSPVASLTGVPASSNEGTAITLGSTVSDASSVDMAAGFAYAWSVTKNGSAFASQSGSASFTFTPDDNGAYVVSLVATDKDGAASAPAQANITVKNVDPRANSLGTYRGTVGAPLQFTGIGRDASTVDTNAGFSYSWDFGDGKTASGAMPQHTYSTSGAYTVTLTVTDKDGGHRASTTTATIGASPLPAPATEFDYLSDNLPAGTIYGTLSWTSMASDGAWGVNAQWEQGQSSKWYIEQQRYGEDLIIGGAIHNNTAAIDAGFQAFSWGFAQQAADGSFTGTTDAFHSTSIFVDAVAHALLVLKQSPYAAQYQPTINTEIPQLYKAAKWMTGSSVWSTGLSNDSPYTHRRYFVADALALTSLLNGGDANLMNLARYEISDGLSLQWSTGVNPEKGGYDASYQLVGLSLAERWVTYFPNEDLTAGVRAMIDKGLQWEAGNVLLSTGEISVVGSTRVGIEVGPSGTIKTVDWKHAVDAFYYWYQLTGDTGWQTDGREVAEFYYRQY